MTNYTDSRKITSQYLGKYTALALTIQRLALDQVEVIGSGENTTTKSPYQPLQIAGIYIENIR